MTQSLINGWMRGGGGGRGESVGAFRMGAHLNIHRNSCVHKGAEMAMSTDALVKINRGPRYWEFWMISLTNKWSILILKLRGTCKCDGAMTIKVRDDLLLPDLQQKRTFYVAVLNHRFVSALWLWLSHSLMIYTILLLIRSFCLQYIDYARNSSVAASSSKILTDPEPFMIFYSSLWAWQDC